MNRFKHTIDKPENNKSSLVESEILIRCKKIKGVQFLMDILKLKDKYLNTIYLKSKNDYVNGVKEDIICKLLGVPIEDTTNLKNYLRDKGLLKNIRHKQDDDIILSTEGLDYCIHRRENKIFKTIKFKAVRYLPSSKAAIEFLYYYDLIDEDGKIEPKTIKVSISDILSFGWGFQIWSSQPDQDYSNLAKMLLQEGKDKIIEKIKKGTLTDNEEYSLKASTHPHSSPYNADNLIEPQNAEYEIEVGQKILGEEINENRLAASINETHAKKDDTRIPKVFISYSYDSMEHEDWVLSLATKLCDNGVDVILDKWDLGALGKPLPDFMEKSITQSQRVICIMTPNYKKKTENLAGGVGYEYSIITSEIFSDGANTSKFIPLLRNGTDTNAIPTALKGRKYVDMRNDSEFEEKLINELLRDIHDEPKFKKPAIGKKPNFEN